MSQWNRIASLADCPPGTSCEFVVEERIVALFNIDGTLHAMDGVCPHQGGPLAQGDVTGCIVTCPWHGWQFDVTTGQHQLNRNYQQPGFAVRIDGNDILIDLDGREGNA